MPDCSFYLFCLPIYSAFSSSQLLSSRPTDLWLLMPASSSDRFGGLDSFSELQGSPASPTPRTSLRSHPFSHRHASNDLFVRHKFLLIKWCVHNQGDREKKLCSQGYYGKPSITSPRPNNNLTVAVTLVFGGVTVGIFGCLVNSLASINSMVSEVNLAVPLKYI